MKTLIICIMAAFISTSHASFFQLFGKGNEQPAPQKFLHHHHHHHEILHKSVGSEHHLIDGHHSYVDGHHEHVGGHPEHVQVYKIIYNDVGHGHGVGHGIEHGIEHGHGISHGPVVYHAPPQVIHKVLHPIVNKNFIHNTHEHHFHKHVAAVPVEHHGHGW